MAKRYMAVHASTHRPTIRQMHTVIDRDGVSSRRMPLYRPAPFETEPLAKLTYSVVLVGNTTLNGFSPAQRTTLREYAEQIGTECRLELVSRIKNVTTEQLKNWLL